MKTTAQPMRGHDESGPQEWSIVDVIGRRVIRKQVQYEFLWDSGESEWCTEQTYSLPAEDGGYTVVFGGAGFLTEAQVTAKMRELDTKPPRARRK